MKDGGYFQFPAIFRDTVFFVSEDDLWSVDAAGGVARRLTSGLGFSVSPAPSPDGRCLAFSGSEEGFFDVYVMPAEGGPARRLTFEDTMMSRVIGWTPPNHRLPNQIVYTSGIAQPFGTHPFGGSHLRTLSPEHGDSRALNFGPAHYLSFAPDGRGAVLARGAVEAARWKRYRGGTAGDLWIDPNGSGEWHRLIRVAGNPSRPLWVGARIYFLSDHEGVGNLYSCSLAGDDLRRHTGHWDFYARNAATDGRRIVYQAGANLFLFDPASGDARKIDIEYRSPRVQRNRKFIDAARYLESYRPHPNENSLALTARGKIAALQCWDGPVHQIGEPASGRHRLGAWMHDGKRIVSVYDAEGEEVLEVRRIDDPSSSEFLRGPEISRVVSLKPSPRHDQVAFTNVRNELVLADLQTRSMRMIDRNRHSPVVDFNFSPDGRYIAYNCCPNRRISILRICRIADGAIFDVTRAVHSDFAPVFDPAGEYLFFIGAREFNPVYDKLHFELGFPKGMRPYVISLRSEVPTPFGRKFERTPKNAPEPTTPPDVTIEFDGILDRIEAFPVPEGIYQQLEPLHGKVLLTSLPVEGSLDLPILTPHEEPEAKAKLEAFDFESKELETWVDGITNFAVSLDRKRLVYRAGNHLRMINTDKKPDTHAATDPPGAKTGWLDLKRVRISIDPSSEWRQMFAETWRLQRDQYWIEDMADVDWKAVYDQYLPLLDKVGSRAELEDLIWEMQGELGASHAYAGGGDFRKPPNYQMGSLGADIEWDQGASAWRITHVVRGDPADSRTPPPLMRLGVNIRDGALIVAVNNRLVTREVSPARLLVHQAGAEVVLTVADTPGATPRNVVVKTAGDDTDMRYREWVERNREWVHEKSVGRCGYIHIPDMGPWGFAEFHRLFLAELDRDGLLIDVRYNRGGHVSQLLLEKLARRRIAQTRSRWFDVEPEPSDSPAGPMVALANQYAGSDGDIFSHTFKRLKLGPLLGMRTWGGVIGIWPRHALADGGVNTQPEFAWWFDDVGWSIENRGAEPDIEVDYPPHDYSAGRDPQLERSLAELMTLLPKEPRPPQFEPRPSRRLPRDRK